MNQRICFVHLENIMAIPYLFKYTQLIDTEYDIIYWDRRGIDETCTAANQYRMRYVISENATKTKKLYGYLKFKLYASRLLRKHDYSAVVLLTSSAAVLLKRVLLLRYPNRYIVDIRDYFKEYSRFYYNAEKKVIEEAGLAVISSAAYRSFLPPHEYLLVHNSPNITEYSMRMFQAVRSKHLSERSGHPMVLSYIGGVRFFEQDRRVLSYFSNDARFRIRYIGAGASLLSEYCEANNIRNVTLHDYFPPEQTLRYYAETDAILNLYGSGTPLLDYALSNKLYYASTLGIPILVCPNTFMEQISVKYGFGFSMKLENSADINNLYTWLLHLNSTQLQRGCDEFMDVVRDEDTIFSERVTKWFQQWSKF